MKELTQKEILNGLSILITNDLNRLNNTKQLNKIFNYYFILENKNYTVKLVIKEK